MHDVRWEHWLDRLTADYFVAAFRPELPAAERLRAAAACAEVLERLGPASMRYVAGQLTCDDTQRRNAAARALSTRGSAAHVQLLSACYLDESRQWLSPAHLVRAARRHPLDPTLAGSIGGCSLRVQPALVRALMAHDRAEARVLLKRLITGPDAVLAEAAVEEVARWRDPGVLWSVVYRADGTDSAPSALVPAAIQACLQLATMGDRSALDWLEERTMDADPALAGMAHVALGLLGWPGCVIELHDLLREADGLGLSYALEAAELMASSALLPSLCDVVLRCVNRNGPGLDDNPSDRAVRILEQLTGRWVAAELCTYDRYGNLDESSRRRAALLFRSASLELPANTRLRHGEPLGVRQLVEDLVSSSARRLRAAAMQLATMDPAAPSVDPREDLIGNLPAVLSWRARVGAEARQDGVWSFAGARVEAPKVGV